MNLTSSLFNSPTRWLLFYVLRISWLKFVLSIFYNTVGLVLTLASIKFTFNVVASMRVGESVSFTLDGYVLIGNMTFYVAIFLVGLMAVLAAFIQYAGERCGLLVAQEFVKTVREDLSKACSSKRGDTILCKLDFPTVSSLINIVSRETSLAVVQIVRIPLALTTTLMCMAAMSTISIKATVVVLLICPIYLLLLGALNRKSGKIHMEYMSLADDSRRLFSKQHEGIERNNLSSSCLYPKNGANPISRSDEIIFDRIAIIRKVGLLNSATLATLVVVIFILVYFGAFGENLDWTAVIAFLVLLRFSSSGLKQVAIATNVISRFLPSIQASRSLCNATTRVNEDNKQEWSTSPRVVAVITDRPNRMSVLKGSIFLSAHDNRFTPGRLAIRLDDCDGSREGECAVAHEATKLYANKEKATIFGGLLVLGRSVSIIDKLKDINIVPEIAVDLRDPYPKICKWPEEVIASEAKLRDDSSDDIQEDLDFLAFE